MHKTAAIISTGDELVLGQTLDTNSRWLADQLVERGITTVEHRTIGDDADALRDAILRLAARVDLIIITGGLGPTADDLTRPALAAALGEPLVEDAGAVGQIEAYFHRVGRAMNPLNRTQAFRPRSATILSNPHGTAPGLHAVFPRAGAGLTDTFCLPGPPREMRPMFEIEVLPRLRVGRRILTRALHCFGIGESDLAARLGDLMSRGHNPVIGTTASSGVVSCRIRYEAAPRDPPDVLAPLESHIRDLLRPFVFGVDSETLPSAVLDLLRARSQTFAVVESCTGGLLGSLVTATPGSSAAFHGGWLTYTNEMKQHEVGVPLELFGPGRPGAVSFECAAAMARGGLARSGGDHCLAVTGIAGPDGGTPEKPIGTVWIARASREGVEARRFLFPWEREAVREWSARTALAMLRLHLIGADARLLRQVE